MTGLDPERDKIMSICCLITDANLKLFDEQGFEIIVHQDKETLDQMDEWCTKTHGKTGLTEACLKSTTTAENAAEGLIKYIEELVPRSRTALLAGNSVHQDKAFLSKAPYDVVARYLHYRILDISSIKEAMRRWAPQEVLDRVPGKKNLHQAKEDILESIEEARFYRDTFFRGRYG